MSNTCYVAEAMLCRTHYGNIFLREVCTLDIPILEEIYILNLRYKLGKVDRVKDVTWWDSSALVFLSFFLKFFLLSLVLFISHCLTHFEFKMFVKLIL